MTLRPYDESHMDSDDRIGYTTPNAPIEADIAQPFLRAKSPIRLASAAAPSWLIAL